MATKHFESTSSIKIVDGNTGEVMDAKEVNVNIFRKVDGEPNYIKFYLQDLGKLMKLSSQSIHVLFELLRLMDYNNEISISIGKKRDICERLKIYIKNTQSGEVNLGTNIIDQHITKLVKSGIIYRKDKGMYVAEPKLFGKGKWSDIKKLIMSVEYTPESNRLINSVIQKGEDI